MLPQYRTLSKLSRCRNFFSLVLGVIMVLNTPTTNQHNRTCFHGVGPFPHFHDVGTSLRFHSVGIYYGAQYPNNGLAQSSMLPQYRTLSKFPWCKNFSLVLGVIMVLDTPIMDQHNRPCFHGIGPFPHFHGVGTSPLMF